MKPANFPARKKARQIAAQVKLHVSCRDIPAETVEQYRTIRTKKNRSASY